MGLAFVAKFYYMRRNIALLSALFHWPQLDDIPAEGVPFPPD